MARTAPARKPVRRIEHLATESIGHPHTQQPDDGSGQACRQLGEAQQAERDRHQPGEEHRLVQEGLAVVDRRHPIPALHDMLRRNRVHALVHIPQISRAQIEEEEKEAQSHKQDLQASVTVLDDTVLFPGIATAIMAESKIPVRALRAR